MSNYNIQRLQKLVTALQDAKPEDFDMSKYGKPCGTPACVLGHYASRRDLQRTFRLAPSVVCQGATVLHDSEGREVHYADYSIVKHFGLDSEDEADELFNSGGCGGAATPQAAVRYIKAFIKRALKRAGRRV